MKVFNLKPKLTVAVFILSLMFVACEKDYDATDIINLSNDPFTFICNGNQWTYGVYDRTSKKLLDTTKWIIFIYNSDNKYTINVYLGSKYNDEYITYLDYKKDIWVLGMHNNMYNDDELFGVIELSRFGYIEGGEKIYVYDSSILSVIEGTAQIVSRSEKVTVPAGTFTNCIKVKVQYPNKREDYYWVHKKFGNIMAEEKNRIYVLIDKNF